MRENPGLPEARRPHHGMVTATLLLASPVLLFVFIVLLLMVLVVSTAAQGQESEGPIAGAFAFAGAGTTTACESPSGGDPRPSGPSDAPVVRDRQGGDGHGRDPAYL